jgi:hypothetical protein
MYMCKMTVDCKILPNEIKVSYYTSNYFSDKLSCQARILGGCCLSPICWCPLINQLRSSKKGKIRIPLKNCATRYDYWIQILATVDDKDTSLLHLQISFDGSCYYILEHIPKSIEAYTVFEIKG